MSTRSPTARAGSGGGGWASSAGYEYEDGGVYDEEEAGGAGGGSGPGGGEVGDGEGKGKGKPRAIAYEFARAAFGHERAHEVADAWGQIDALTLQGGALIAQYAAARGAVLAYVAVLHVYFLALVLLPWGGPELS